VIALLLRAPSLQAAAYLPGQTDPDPPTGDVAPVDAAAPTAPPFEWRFAPWRTSGTLSLETRRLRLEDGSRSTTTLLVNDTEWSSWLWQPWFVQVRAGLGLLAARDSLHGFDTPPSTSNSGAMTGHATIEVFPLSRFPFELRADLSDSRVRGDTLGADYRNLRFGFTQSYRPESGNDAYQLTFDHSRLRSDGLPDDTVDTLHATALRQMGPHSFELAGAWTRNRRDGGLDGDDSTRITSLSARHAFQAAEALNVDTLATWNDARLSTGAGASRLENKVDIRQLSSFVTWRPREGQWLGDPASPTVVTASARWIDAGSGDAEPMRRVRSMNASLGVTRELTRDWRLGASVSAAMVEPDDAARASSTAGALSLTWSPLPVVWSDAWRYAPTVSASVGGARSSEAGLRHTAGAQFVHGLTWAAPFVPDAPSWSANLTQSLGVLHESQPALTSRAIAHSASLFWQGAGDGLSQAFASLSASDARTWTPQPGRFQLLNLQLSRRTQLSRHLSWSANLTLQESRSDAVLLDPFTGLERRDSPGWQGSHSGTLSVEHGRFLDVPRLRATLLVSANTQQFEQRAFGDIEAPRERITESIEGRVDYAIGRLEARLSARMATVEGRRAASLLARVQRRY
jgi:hypothetical protein